MEFLVILFKLGGGDGGGKVCVWVGGWGPALILIKKDFYSF